MLFIILNIKDNTILNRKVCNSLLSFHAWPYLFHFWKKEWNKYCNEMKWNNEINNQCNYYSISDLREHILHVLNHGKVNG